jgi:ComF family protein
MSIMSSSLVEYLKKFTLLLFPQTVHAGIVEKLDTMAVQAEFSRCHLDSGVTSLSCYAHEAVTALIHEAKFKGNERACYLLGHLLQRFLEENMDNTLHLLLPVPLSAQRFRSRGYNQVSKIIRCTTIDPRRFLMREDILERARETLPQTTLTRQERLQNVDGAFRVRNEAKISGMHVLVIDDVTTTGATLHAARTALLPYSPASVTLVALAH